MSGTQEQTSLPYYFAQADGLLNNFSEGFQVA